MVHDNSTFWQRQNAIANAENLTSSQKLLLYVLNNHVGNGAVAWPSIATLCKASGLAEKSVRRTIKALQTAGILDVETGGGRTSNRYTISLSALSGTSGQSASGHDQKPGHDDQGSTGQTAGAGVAEFQDEQPRTTTQHPKAGGSKILGRRVSAAEAWAVACEAVQRFDPLYEPDRIRELLDERTRSAARAVGGLPRIAGRDRYTTTKIRAAFIEAYNEQGAAHV